MNNYIDKIKKEQRTIRFYRIFLIMFFIFIWELFSRLKIVNSFIFSSPSLVINNIILMFKSNILFNNILVTSYEVLLSFIITSILAFIISSLFYNNKMISKILLPYFTILNSLPKVAFGPLIIITIGSNISSIIFMAFIISFFVTSLNLYNSFINTNEEYITLLKSFKASKKNIFIHAVLGSNLLNIINALKINLSMCFIGLLPPVGEKIFFNKCYSRY